jgi:hypothetical protein
MIPNNLFKKIFLIFRDSAAALLHPLLIVGQVNGLVGLHQVQDFKNPNHGVSIGALGGVNGHVVLDRKVIIREAVKKVVNENAGFFRWGFNSEKGFSESVLKTF